MALLPVLAKLITVVMAKELFCTICLKVALGIASPIFDTILLMKLHLEYWHSKSQILVLDQCLWIAFSLHDLSSANLHGGHVKNCWTVHRACEVK